MKSIDDAFNTRDLVKVKVLETAPGSPREMADAIVALRDGVHVVQTIGRIAVLYRPEEAKSG